MSWRGSYELNIQKKEDEFLVVLVVVAIGVEVATTQ